MKFVSNLISALLVLSAIGHAVLASYPDDISNLDVVFAQVREDSDVEVGVIDQFFPSGPVDVAVVASGGCTVVRMAQHDRIRSIAVVDSNDAQIALTKVKLQLQHAALDQRLRILGHLPMASDTRGMIISGLLEMLQVPKYGLGDPERVAELGIDYIGRYEGVFRELQNQLGPVRDQLDLLFKLDSVDEQADLVAPTTVLGDALRDAFEHTFSLHHLVRVFGKNATSNHFAPYPEYFMFQLRLYLNNHLARDSPYLAQMLLGKFYGNITLPWMSKQMNTNNPPVSFHQETVREFITNAKTDSLDVISLSNTLDWSDNTDVKHILHHTVRVLKPGGYVIVRQLNSNRELVHFDRDIRWMSVDSNNNEWHDRSGLYNKIMVGQTPVVNSHAFTSLAPRVTEMADDVLDDDPILEELYFQHLSSGEMTLHEFQHSQIQFFFAVDYFSRPMTALLARLQHHRDRLAFLSNVVEEHGNFERQHYHSNTFKEFLRRIGVSDVENVTNASPGPAVHGFNVALMGASTMDSPLIGIACNGIIEYAFAEISARIAHDVVQRGWISHERIIHYDVHADLDLEHAELIFRLLEPHVHQPESHAIINAGLRLGKHIFGTLYRQIYTTSLQNMS